MSVIRFDWTRTWLSS